MKNNKKMNKVLLVIQFLLTISVLIFMILTFFNDASFFILQLLLGVVLIIMGINQIIIYKHKKKSIFYFVVGIGVLAIVLFDYLGVIA